jgi:hypothetical protein
MERTGNNNHLSQFEFEGFSRGVTYLETTKIEGYPDVECDVYKFDGDDSKDLGIIRINKGGFTPLQRVNEGERTVEGRVSGSGRFIVIRADRTEEIYAVGGSIPFSVEVKKGDSMQWRADTDSNLVAYEVCIPPYKDGRFENISFEELASK